MARREVTPDDTPNEGGKFLKMKDIFQKEGDKFTALYLRDEPATGQYKGTDYTFQTDKEGTTKVMTAKGQLETALKKAAPFEAGEKVTITLVELKDIGKENPMRLFKLNVDDIPAWFKPAEEDAPF